MVTQLPSKQLPRVRFPAGAFLFFSSLSSSFFVEMKSRHHLPISVYLTCLIYIYIYSSFSSEPDVQPVQRVQEGQKPTRACGVLVCRRALELHYSRIEYLFSRLSILSILFTMRSKIIMISYNLDFNHQIIRSYDYTSRII